MKGYLKEKGAGVWKQAIGGSVPLKNNSKFAAQKEEKKNDALALKTIFNGLSSSIKESMGQCTSAKDLWLKLEKTYHGRIMKLNNLQNPLIAIILNVLKLNVSLQVKKNI